MQIDQPVLAEVGGLPGAGYLRANRPHRARLVAEHEQARPCTGRNPVLHHVAVVVADLDAAVARYESLGFTGGERFTLPEQAVDVATFRSGTGWIELIRPLDPEGPIARFLSQAGRGDASCRLRGAGPSGDAGSCWRPGVRLDRRRASHGRSRLEDRFCPSGIVRRRAHRARRSE